MIFHSCIVVYLLSNQNCFVISDTFSCDHEVIDKKGDSGPFLALHQHMSVRVPYIYIPAAISEPGKTANKMRRFKILSLSIGGRKWDVLVKLF